MTQINSRATLISLTELMGKGGQMRTVLVAMIMSITTAETTYGHSHSETETKQLSSNEKIPAPIDVHVPQKRWKVKHAHGISRIWAKR